MEQNKILTSIKGRNSIANLRNMTHYNPNGDLVNDKVCKKFGLNLSICSPDIVRTKNELWQNDRENDRKKDRANPVKIAPLWSPTFSKWGYKKNHNLPPHPLQIKRNWPFKPPTLHPLVIETTGEIMFLFIHHKRFPNELFCKTNCLEGFGPGQTKISICHFRS